MPTVREYKDGRGYFVLASIEGRVVTFQVTRSGAGWLRRHGYSGGDWLDVGDFRGLYARGGLYTGGGGVAVDGGETPEFTATVLWRRRRERARLRRRSALAKTRFHEAFPRPSARRRFAGILAASIRTAHAANGMGWAVTLGVDSRDFLSLSVGRLDVLTCSRTGQVKLLVHEPLVSQGHLEWLRRHRRVGRRHQFKSRPRAVPVYLDASELRQWYPKLRTAHRHVITALAYLVDHNPYSRTHSPGLVRYLRKTGFGVPVPERG